MAEDEMEPLEALLDAKNNLEGVAACIDLNALQFDRNRSMEAIALQYLVCRLNEHVRALEKAIEAVDAALNEAEAKAKKKKGDATSE